MTDNLIGYEQVDVLTCLHCGTKVYDAEQENYCPECGEDLQDTSAIKSACGGMSYSD